MGYRWRLGVLLFKYRYDVQREKTDRIQPLKKRDDNTAVLSVGLSICSSEPRIPRVVNSFLSTLPICLVRLLSAVLVYERLIDLFTPLVR